jgi:mRNA interferase RelE/StbE
MAVVRLTSEAKEDLRDLDGAERKIAAKGLKKLEDEPEKRGAPLGAGKKGDLSTFRKLVVGNRDYRIVYRVEPDGSVCVVWVIAKREDSVVYDLAVSRLKLYSERTDLAAELERIIETARRIAE